jgi:hypothetical protein
MTPIPTRDAVAEIQGLYGPFSFPEKIFQKIWRRREFDATAAVLDDGRKLEVLHPGKLNLLGGPDFKGARLRLGGVAMTGDVELHLHAEDWVSHGHAADPAYANVVLHVVLFPSRPDWSTIGAEGRIIPSLTVLPLLHHDLEEYAADEAVEVLANRPLARACEELGRLPPAELTALLRRGARERWRQKLHFARVRLERLGWSAACHHAALEILGYRFNRSAMLRIASRWPLAAWASDALDIDAIRAGEGSGWNVHGVRPANHPRVRLAQYRAWVRACPDWPTLLEALAVDLPDERSSRSETATTDYRRAQHLRQRRADLVDRLCGNAVSGTRFDNLCCDGFLPLLAVRTGRDLTGLWFHWFPGDAPPHLVGMLRELDVTGRTGGPLCHGWVQGLLRWLLEREARESGVAPPPSLEREAEIFSSDSAAPTPHLHRVALPTGFRRRFSGAGLDKF